MRGSFVVLALCSLVLACNQNGQSMPSPSPIPSPSQTPAPAPTVMMSGKVVNNFGNPVADAEIIVLDGPDSGRKVISNVNGEYKFEALTTGDTNFSAKANGHYEQRQGTFVNGANALNFSLKKMTITFTSISQGVNARAPNCGGATFRKESTSFFSKPGCSVNGARGFNVAAIDPNGNVIDVRNYDTYLLHENAGGNMINYINSLPNGTLLLIAVGDEGGLAPYNAVCKTYGTMEPFVKFLENLGAREIRGYCYWDSFSFIAIKGKGAVAENLSKTTQAVTSYDLPVAP